MHSLRQVFGVAGAEAAAVEELRLIAAVRLPYVPIASLIRHNRLFSQF